MKTYNEYYKILEKKDTVRPKVIWIPFALWYNRKFNFGKKLLMDFGSSKESNCFKKSKIDNDGKLKYYRGYDIDNSTLEWLKINNIYYDFWNNNSLNEKFDMINCSQCYEHLDLEQREKLIERSYDLLKKDGILIIDMPHIANLNIIEFFRRDRTHKPISREEEVIYIELFGYNCEIYLVGLTMPYKSMIWNLWNILRNILFGFYPQWNTVIIARKIKYE